MARKLGEVQEVNLRNLRERGEWHRGTWWLWDTLSNTERIMESLVKRGLATKAVEKRYKNFKTTVYRPVVEDNSG